MKNAGKSKNLLTKLARDPRLKRVIAKARRPGRGNARAKVESATDVFLLALTIASRFAKKKKARALDELADLVYVLVQASLLLKENIFDRPEVKDFFSRTSKRIYSIAQECVASIVPKAEAFPPMRSRAKPKRDIAI